MGALRITFSNPPHPVMCVQRGWSTHQGPHWQRWVPSSWHRDWHLPGALQTLVKIIWTKWNEWREEDREVLFQASWAHVFQTPHEDNGCPFLKASPIFHGFQSVWTESVPDSDPFSLARFINRGTPLTTRHRELLLREENSPSACTTLACPG